MDIPTLLIVNEAFVTGYPGKYQSLTRQGRVSDVVGYLKLLTGIGHEQSHAALFGKCLKHGAGKRPYVSNDPKITVQELSPYRFRESIGGEVDPRPLAEWF